MHKEMYTATTADHHDHLAVFMQQMIPHHTNAVNMARLLLKFPDEEEMDEDLTHILYGIINQQNFQIHQFRNHLGSVQYTQDACSLVGTACSNDEDCMGAEAKCGQLSCVCGAAARQLLFGGVAATCQCA